MRELNPGIHHFWEDVAAYTFKDLSRNYLFKAENEIINSLLVPRLNSYFILNLASGYPKLLIDLLLATGSDNYLVNIDLSSRIIKKANEYCEKSGFQLDSGVFSKHGLQVENIRADITSLTLLKNLSKLKNEIKKDYPGIFILALNCLSNLHILGDEGLNGTIQMINFFSFGDAFFATMQSYLNVLDRLAYYQRHIKAAELIQFRMVYFSSKGKMLYGLKIEKKRNDLFDCTEPDITKLLTRDTEYPGRGVIVDFLSADCQHTGYRTLLVTPVFTRYLFERYVPEFDIDLCGYPVSKSPPSPVVLPVAGNKGN